AKNHGIDITDQSARSVNSNDYSYYDIIYAMDTMNLRDLKAWAVDANEEGKIRLILNEIDNFPTESVPDPYFNDNGFEAVFNMLDKACDAIIKKYG
ncbi:MAG: low molecular weight phosphotyrosine protein phosphatase, partial [Bacteroidetes bacterium]|nr:low molecular weight phosphotyrosine protein phosphatase [Bacteroidota bacterium]